MKRIMYFVLVIALLITSGCGAKSTQVETSKPSERNTSSRSEDDSNYDKTSFMTTTDAGSLVDIDLNDDASDVRDLSADAGTEPITKDVNAGADAEQITKENGRSIIGDSIPTNVKSSGANSPEAAAIAYLEALRDADIKRMMDAFYIDRLFMNIEMASETIGGELYNYSTTELPNSNEFLISMNKLNSKKDVLSQIVEQYAMLGAYESGLDVPFLKDNNLYYIGDETEVMEFTAQLEVIFDAPKLDAIKIIGFIEPEKIFYEISNNTNNDAYLQLADMVFADNAASCIVVFEIESNTYLLCLDAVDYGGEWFVNRLDGFIGWEIERLLNLSHSIQGLVPLFAINAYNGAYNNDILILRETVLAMMDIYEDQEITPSTNAGSPVVSYDEPGYSSPEEAVRAFLEALRDTDLDRIMSACGIAHYAENLDFEAYYLRYRAYSKNNNDAKIPNINDFSKAISLENIKANKFADLFQFYSRLCIYEAEQLWSGDSLDYWESMYSSGGATEMTEELAEQLNAIFNALNLDMLSVLGVINLEPTSTNLTFAMLGDDSSIFEKYFGEMNQENILKQNIHTGADSIGECIAFFEINGNMYSLFLSTLEYNGKWYVRSFSGNNFSSLSSMAAYMVGLVPVSQVFREYGDEAFVFSEEALRAALELMT